MTHIHIGADHEGYALGQALIGQLAGAGHDVSWHGAPAYDEGDDYPAVVVRAMQAVVTDEDAGRDARAVLIAGSAAGAAIAANKVVGGRVVAADDVADVVVARFHADANGLVIPVGRADAASVPLLVMALLDSPFSGELDDARRLVNIAEYESSGTIEGWKVEA